MELKFLFGIKNIKSDPPVKDPGISRTGKKKKGKLEMANINIKCPYCQATLEADSELIGMEVKCVVCGKMFIAKAPDAPAPGSGPNGAAKNGSAGIAFTVKDWILIALVVLSLAFSALSFFGSSSPKLDFCKTPEKALKSLLAYKFDSLSSNTYFWRKNSGEILKSLEIKETKIKGNCAAVFYKLSKGATEVKDVEYFYKSSDGYWIPITDRDTLHQKFSGNMELIEKGNEFTRDSGHFDVSDI